jgi:hypothetical protein
VGPYPEGWSAGSTPFKANTHQHDHRQDPYPDYLASSIRRSPQLGTEHREVPFLTFLVS